MTNLAVLLVSLLGLCLCHSSQKVYYVKPAGPSSSSSSSECPSSSLPCHSLQYYINHSNFTNNSLFLFLAGEHHLDSVVDISEVANLSLEGASSGVKILCNSFPSGFNIREFIGLSIKKINVSNCTQLDQIVAINLESGSELSVDNVAISNSYGEAFGLMVTSVTGSLKISNSFFPVFQGGRIGVNFTSCNQPSYFNFTHNRFKSKDESQNTPSLYVIVQCSDVHLLLADSSFEGGYSLIINFCVLRNTSLVVSNSSFDRTYVWAGNDSNCEITESDTYCSSNLITFTQISAAALGLVFDTPQNTTINNCIVAIEDSLISSNSDVTITSDFVSEPNMTDIIQAKISNVIFKGAFCEFYDIAILIENSTFEKNAGRTAIKAESSNLIFKGHNTILNNEAYVGGGIQLTSSSYIFLQPHTHILFENNHADYVGGAIYVDSKENDPCFFHVAADSPPLNETIEVHFINNSADLGGFSLYGNNIAQCNNLHNFFFNISNTESIPSAVASDPYKVCLCGDNRNQPNCSGTDVNEEKVITVFPGEDFTLRLAIAGNLDGVIAGVIRAYFDNSSSNATLGTLQSSQITRRPQCENLTYTVYSTRNKESIVLIPELIFFTKKIDADIYVDGLTVDINLFKCPVGFLFKNSTSKCECEDVLTINGITCDINNQSISRHADTWIGFINVSDTHEVIILFHPYCPVGYCLPYNTSITSNTSDSQCAPHRTGLLCGKCQQGYSLTLGSGTCNNKCSNTYLLIILPLAVSGLLLVAILFALNLTVTEGTINGLILYANVIGMNHSTLYSGEANWLYTFLAWLNLDLGITTCFYDGMDGYTQTWLQFIFPVYLWIIILVIIKLYNRFLTLANRLGGGNAVKVLATLLILSYTKLQRTVVTIMSFTTLEYPDGVIRYVWLYDANLDYFKGKHLYLGLASIFALVFFIAPYTLCLVFFQQLQASSNHFLFRWVNKFKPLFDSYAGPYKDRYRFWTGMLLLVRTLLIILFTVNTSGSVDFNLLIILTTSLFLSLANSNGTYKKWPLNYLETFFYIQLGVFAGGIMYARHNPGNVSTVANTSIGLSLAVFLIMIVYHLLLGLYALKGYYYHVLGYADLNLEDDPSFIHERPVN